MAIKVKILIPAIERKARLGRIKSIEGVGAGRKVGVGKRIRRTRIRRRRRKSEFGYFVYFDVMFMYRSGFIEWIYRNKDRWRLGRISDYKVI